ncbi:MAG: hypothetical protein ABID54_01920 [Pseudomonadota bacterium]
MNKRGIRFLLVPANATVGNLFLISAIMITISLILLSGCSTILKDVSSSGEVSEAKPLKTEPLPIYYDFEDISVPPELKLDRERSFIYETPTVKAGILVFKGRVDVDSLVSFFKENMVKDNWNFINSFKYKGYILNFQKEDRSCLITLYDKMFNTIVEMRVGPLHAAIEEPK